MSSTYTATSSSELMENYIQSDILEPQQAFTALQTDTGASLLFSIGTGAVFYVTQELPGAAHGWSLTDLSSAQVRQDFPAGATAKTFAAAETVAVPPQPAAIHLAMVLNDGTADHLYLSLGNSASDTGWTANPVWTPCPFNATDGAGNPIPMPSPFSIVGVMISEATEGEYIVVDIVGNPGDPVGLVSRFYIDVSTPANPVWTPRSLPIDVNAASYASCLGRTSKNLIEPDGFYTTGTVVNAPQLIYMPLYDPLSPSVTPASSRLTLPGGLAAEAIAACRNADNTSDLYVTAQGGLYYFAAANQADQAVAVLLVSSPLLTGVRNLYAYAAGDSVTVWGLNGSDQVFYLACPAAQLTTPSAWNVPLAIMTGVDAISPYVDRMYSANTFFAHGADGLIKAVKTPTTGLWSSRNITLPPSDVQQDATRISSYTTRILVNGPDGLPAANVSVSLTATSVTSVLINHLYYVVGPTPITLTTDAFGTITIVEMVDTLAGTRFTATVSGVALAINPMDPPFQRNAQYTTVQSLQGPGVVITNQDGSTQPFIPAGTSATDLASVAQSNQDLASAYASLATSSPPSSPGVRTAAAGVLPHAADGILTDLGDLFEWLKSGIESVVSIVWDAVGKAWNFVATIGDQIYYGVLDGVEKVVAAATWVYNAIKIAVEDVVKFLSFLFSWPDILITHQVLRNVFSLFLTNAVTSLGDVKTDLDNLFQTLQSDIGSWADFPDLTQTASSTTASNPPVAGQNSAPAHLGLHHFQGNAANSQSDYAPADPALAIFDDLYQAWQKEEATLQAAFDQFKTIIDNFSSESLSDIIKQLLAVLVDTLLQSAQNILDALLTLLIQLATGASDVLTQPLNIPVLSWLYKDLTGQDLTFADLICLIIAIPVTVIYKLAAGAAPFPKDDPFTVGLLGATTFEEVTSQFFDSSPQGGATPARATLAAAAPVLDESNLKTFAFASSICALFGAATLSIINGVKLAYSPDPLPFPKTFAAIACAGNLVYVSPNISGIVNITTGNWSETFNSIVTIISIGKSVAFIPAAEVASTAPPVALGFAAAESVLNLVWNVPVIANIIANHGDADTTYRSLTPESIGNFAFNLGGMLEIAVEYATASEPKAVLIGIQDGLMLGYGLMEIIAGSVYRFAPGQSH